MSVQAATSGHQSPNSLSPPSSGFPTPSNSPLQRPAQSTAPIDFAHLNARRSIGSSPTNSPRTSLDTPTQSRLIPSSSSGPLDRIALTPYNTPMGKEVSPLASNEMAESMNKSLKLTGLRSGSVVNGSATDSSTTGSASLQAQIDQISEVNKKLTRNAAILEDAMFRVRALLKAGMNDKDTEAIAGGEVEELKKKMLEIVGGALAAVSD